MEKLLSGKQSTQANTYSQTYLLACKVFKITKKLLFSLLAFQKKSLNRTDVLHRGVWNVHLISKAEARGEGGSKGGKEVRKEGGREGGKPRYRAGQVNFCEFCEFKTSLVHIATSRPPEATR